MAFARFTRGENLRDIEAGLYAVLQTLSLAQLETIRLNQPVTVVPGSSPDPARGDQPNLFN